MSSPKEQEALACLKEAENCLKTGMLKWKPDYDGAANEYEKAATCYKTVKNFQKCVECLIKAADMYKQNRSFYSAAKAYEQVAMIAGKELGKWDIATKNIEKACGMYREHGVPDTAALCLDRGAKMVEPQNPAKAAEFFAVASDISLIEGKQFQGAEFAGKSARVHMKLKNLDEAVKMIEKQFSLLADAADERQCGRVVVHLVLVHLARDDYVAAKKTFSDNSVYVEQQELCTLATLLDAWESTDSKRVISSLNHPFIKSLDNEITKLVRTMQQKHSALIGNNPDPESGAQEVSEMDALL